MTRRLLLTGFILVGLAALALALRAPLRRWQQRRLLAAAAKFISQGDLRSASLSARQVLHGDPANCQALEIMARVSQAAGSPEAILWQQRLVDAAPGEVRPAIDLAGIALGFGETYIADKTLAEIPKPGRDSVSFHSAAAALAVETGRLDEAETHLDRAASLEPSNLQLRLNLAAVRLKSSDPSKNAAARETLARLSAVASVRPAALRALIADARGAGDAPRALQFARDLAREPAAATGDHLLLLEELQHSNSRDFPAELRARQQAAVTPAAAGALLAWMNAHGLAADALGWVKTLPEAGRGRMPVPLLVAEALAFTSDWNALRAHLSKGEWGDLEFLRDAFHARLLHETGSRRRTAEFKDRWERAVVDTAGNPASLSMLARLVQGWGWQEEAAQVWWLLAGRNSGQRPALKALYRLFNESKNTRELHRVALRILEVEPDNPVAKNNAAMLSLLLGENTAGARRLAEENYRAHPGVAAFTSTLAFALFQQGRNDDAMRLMQALPESAAEDPSTSACRGIILAAAGEREKARPFLDRASAGNSLFPEERALVEKALNQP